MGLSPAQQVYGPIFMGVIFNVLLYGITVTQTYLYFSTYKHDKTWMKALVLILFLIDTGNCVMDTLLIYDPLIHKFGNPEVLTRGETILGTDPSLTAGITVLVQFFFAWRVKVLTGSKPIVIFIIVGAVGGFIGAVGTGIWISIVTEYAQMRKFKPVAIVWIVCASTVDLVITSTLVWHLRKNKTGMSATDDVVDKIIRMTVQTGLITSMVAIADLAAYLISPSTMHLAFNLPLPKLYTNTLMSTLNARGGWGMDASDHMTVHPSSINIQTNHTAKRVTQQIFVNVEQHETVDAGPGDIKHHPHSASTLPLPA